MEGENRYTGLWITQDGYIRQHLLPGGRYDEARGDQLHAFTGSYQIKGNKIEYCDDKGFTASGKFNGDILYHGGYTFYREKEEKEKTRRNFLTQLSYLF